LLYDIPIIEVRSASNYVGERDKSKWDIDLAAKQLGWVCGCV
jgi:futalosine hydrolase